MHSIRHLEKVWMSDMLLNLHFPSLSDPFALLYAWEDWFSQITSHLQSSFQLDSANGKHQWKIRKPSRERPWHFLPLPSLLWSLYSSNSYNSLWPQLLLMFLQGFSSYWTLIHHSFPLRMGEIMASHCWHSHCAPKSLVCSFALPHLWKWSLGYSLFI